MKLRSLLLFSAFLLSAEASLSGQDSLEPSGAALACSFVKPEGRRISFVCEIDGVQKSFPDRVLKSGFTPEAHILLTLSHSLEEPVLGKAWTPEEMASEEMETIFIRACPEAIDRKLSIIPGCENFSDRAKDTLRERFSFGSQELENAAFCYDKRAGILVAKAKPRHIDALETILDAVKQKPAPQPNGNLADSEEEEWDVPHAHVQEPEKLKRKLAEIILSEPFPFDDADALPPENYFKRIEELGKKYDTSGEGVKIEVRRWPGAERALPSESKSEEAKIPLIIEKVCDLPLGEAIRYACRAFNLKFQLSGDRVLVGPLDMPLSSLETVRHQFGEGSEARLLEFAFDKEASKPEMPSDLCRFRKIRGAKYDYDPATRIATFINVPENLQEIEYAVSALDTAWCPAIAVRTPQMEADVVKLKGKPILVKGVIKKLSAAPAKNEFFSPYWIAIESIEEWKGLQSP